MNVRAPMTRAQALAFIAEHDLNYMDLFNLVAAYAESIDGAISGRSARISVVIKQRPRAKKAAKKVKR